MCNFVLQISHLPCKPFHHDWQFMCKLFLNVLTCFVNFICFWSDCEQIFLKHCNSCVNFVPTFSAHCTLVSKPSVNFISVSRRACGCACRGPPPSAHGMARDCTVLICQPLLHCRPGCCGLSNDPRVPEKESGKWAWNRCELKLMFRLSEFNWAKGCFRNWSANRVPSIGGLPTDPSFHFSWIVNNAMKKVCNDEVEYTQEVESVNGIREDTTPFPGLGCG